MDFLNNLKQAIKKNGSLLCIGLDTDKNKIPKYLLETEDPVFEFNKAVIDATHDLVCTYKTNIAYYASEGIEGLTTLKKTIDYIHKQYPDIPVILDAKRADVGSTSIQYAKEVFDVLHSDAVTVNPYFGLDSLEPFLEYKDKGIIVLCKTSNPGAYEFQDLLVDNEPLYIKVAKKIVEWNKKYQNCLMVVGATWPEELGKIREITKDMFFLVPGIGTQGGDLEKTLKFGLTKEKSGLIIHVARAILYANSTLEFATKAREKAMEFKMNINQYRK